MDNGLVAEWWSNVQGGHWEALPGLLARGADARWREADGDTALHYVCRAPFADERERLRWVRVLLKHKANPNAHSERIVPVIAVAVHAAADHAVRALREAGARLNVARQAGAPLLYVVAEAWAAAGDDQARVARLVRIARYLIREGCDVNARSVAYRQTALIDAVHHDLRDCVQLLLRAPRLNVNLRDHLGLGALHYAAHMGRGWAVRRLLAAGARPNLTDRYGFTPLHEAAANGHADIVRDLLAAGADPGRRLTATLGDQRRGATPLALARAAGQADVIALLTADGA